MNSVEKKETAWEKEVRKVTTELVDPGTSLAKTREGQDKDSPGTGAKEKREE